MLKYYYQYFLVSQSRSNGAGGEKGQTGAQGEKGQTGTQGSTGTTGIQGNIDNNILTSTGTTTNISGSAKYTFDGDTVHLEGNMQIDQQTLTDGATVTWDVTNGSNAKVTLGGNRTLAITNAVTGDTGVILVKQGSGTTYTLTLPAGSVLIGGGSYTTTTTSNGVDVLGFYYDGTNYYWTVPQTSTAGEKGATGEKGQTGAQGTNGTALIKDDGSNRVAFLNGTGTFTGSADFTFVSSSTLAPQITIGAASGQGKATFVDNETPNFNSVRINEVLYSAHNYYPISFKYSSSLWGSTAQMNLLDVGSGLSQDRDWETLH